MDRLDKLAEKIWNNRDMESLERMVKNTDSIVLGDICTEWLFNIVWENNLVDAGKIMHKRNSERFNRYIFKYYKILNC